MRRLLIVLVVVLGLSLAAGPLCAQARFLARGDIGPEGDGLYTLDANGTVLSRLTVPFNASLTTDISTGPDGKVYLSTRNDIWRYDGGDSWSLVFTPAAAGRISEMDWMPDGGLLIPDDQAHQVLRDHGPNSPTPWAQYGAQPFISADGKSYASSAIAKSNGTILVSWEVPNGIYAYNPDGTPQGLWLNPAQKNDILQMAQGPDGSIWLGGAPWNYLSRFDASGAWLMNVAGGDCAWGCKAIGSYVYSFGWESASGSRLLSRFDALTGALDTSFGTYKTGGGLYAFGEIPVPEPGSLSALAAGLVSLGGLALRRRK